MLIRYTGGESPGFVFRLKDLFESKPYRHKKGQVILHQGDELRYIYYVQKGFVKVYSISEAGDKQILLIFSPGDAFPLYRDISSENYVIGSYYEAMTDIMLTRLDRKEFNELLNNDSEAAKLVYNYNTKISADLIERLASLESENARKKLVHLLPYLIRVCGNETSPRKYQLEMKVTHEDIAGMLGLTRETASIHLKKLENIGVVTYNRGNLIINEDRLVKVLATT